MFYQTKHGGMGYIHLEYIVHASAYALEISEHSRKSKKR